MMNKVQIVFLFFVCFVLAFDDYPGWKTFLQSELREQGSEVALSINGSWPNWLDHGYFIKIGPGRMGLGSHNFTHLFDGFGKLNRYRIGRSGNGAIQVYFNSRFILSNSYSDSLSAGDTIPMVYTDDLSPTLGIVKKVEALNNGKEANYNVNIVKIGNRFLATTDRATVFEFDPETLKSIGDVTFADNLAPDGKVIPMGSAHPIIDSDGVLYNFMMVFHWESMIGFNDTLKFFRMKPTSGQFSRELISSIPVRHLTWIHAFTLLNDKAIIFNYPAKANMLRIVEDPTFMNFIEWRNDLNTEVYIIDVKTGNTRILQMDPIFGMHHLNSYETDTSYVVDVETYEDNVSILKQYEFDYVQSNPDNMPIPIFKRITIPKSNGNIQIQDIGKGVTMPRFNELWIGKKYCYIYGLIVPNIIGKIDICNGGKMTSWEPKNQYTSEAVFVPRPGGIEEDDGVLLITMFDGDKEQSYLQVLDAKSLKPLAEAVSPLRVPFGGLHGQFYWE